MNKKIILAVLFVGLVFYLSQSEVNADCGGNILCGSDNAEVCIPDDCNPDTDDPCDCTTECFGPYDMEDCGFVNYGGCNNSLCTSRGWACVSSGGCNWTGPTPPPPSPTPTPGGPTPTSGGPTPTPGGGSCSAPCWCEAEATCDAIGGCSWDSDGGCDPASYGCCCCDGSSEEDAWIMGKVTYSVTGEFWGDNESCEIFASGIDVFCDGFIDLHANWYCSGGNYFLTNDFKEDNDVTCTLSGLPAGYRCVDNDCSHRIGSLVAGANHLWFYIEPIPPPTNLDAYCSCDATGNCTADLRWDEMPGVTAYSLRVDNETPSWNGNCAFPNLGDICEEDVPNFCTNTCSCSDGVCNYSFSGDENHDYDWWIHSKNAGGSSDAVFGNTFTCKQQAPPPPEPPNCRLVRAPVCIFEGELSTFQAQYDERDGNLTTAAMAAHPGNFGENCGVTTYLSEQSVLGPGSYFFDWTPSSADSGSYYILSCRAEDDLPQGCWGECAPLPPQYCLGPLMARRMFVGEPINSYVLPTSVTSGALIDFNFTSDYGYAGVSLDVQDGAVGCNLIRAQCGGNPHDSNDCWWQWRCTASVPGFYTATFSTNEGCQYDTNYSVISASCEIDITDAEVDVGDSVDKFVGISSPPVGGLISRVDFTINPPLIAEVDPLFDILAVFSTTITGIAVGNTTYTAVATMDNGVTTCEDTATVTVNNPDGWWQAIGGSAVAGGGSLTSVIPAGCNLPVCNPFIVLGGSMPIASGSINPGTGGVSESTQSVENSSYEGDDYDYSHFRNKLPSTLYDLTDRCNIVGGYCVIDEADLISEAGTRYPATGRDYYYLYDGSLGFGNLAIENGSAINLTDNKVIILATNTDVYINDDIGLTDGSGFFMIIADRDIVVQEDVVSMVGIYYTDATFYSGTAGGADVALTVIGNVSANAFNIQRDLPDNSQTPAQVFEFSPAVFMGFPWILGDENISWLEVAP